MRLISISLLLTSSTLWAQKPFSTPAQAVEALIVAAEHNDTAALMSLLGPRARDIVESGDPASDKILRAEFAHAARESLHLDTRSFGPSRVTFTVGNQQWPFPIPVVFEKGMWRLDASSGRMELLARRIGRNETNTIEVCRGYVEAQLEYSSGARDKDHILKYAQKVVSTPGTHDGLLTPGDPDSLVAPGFAKAVFPLTDESKAEPYHGYYFRVLKSQGPAAVGGAMSYVVDGKMIGGFALVAWPAQYGVSGIRTYLINYEGAVYDKDLGASTATLAAAIGTYNPDKSWRQRVLD